MFKEFKTFLMRGNVVDLAVAFVIGSAFTAIVTAVVKDLITPLLAIPGTAANFANLHFTVRHSQFFYGEVVNAAISFLVVAFVVFLVVVYPLSRLNARRAPTTATERPCPECLSVIPVAATRCAFCTAQVTPVDV